MRPEGLCLVVAAALAIVLAAGGARAQLCGCAADDQQARPPSSVLYLLLGNHNTSLSAVTQGFSLLQSAVTALGGGSTVQMRTLLHTAPLAAGELDAFTQIWVVDFNAQPLDTEDRAINPNMAASYTVIANWWTARGESSPWSGSVSEARRREALTLSAGRPAVIADGRFWGSLGISGMSTEPAMIRNYLHTLHRRFGGLVLATDHSPDFSDGMNDLMARLGFAPFQSSITAGYVEVDEQSPVINTPSSAWLTSGVNLSTEGKFVTGFSDYSLAPVGLQPNNLVLYRVGYAPGNLQQVFISSTISGAAGFVIGAETPTCQAVFDPSAQIAFSGLVENEFGTQAPYVWNWIDVRRGVQIGNSASFSLPASAFFAGDNTIVARANASNGQVADVVVCFSIRVLLSSLTSSSDTFTPTFSPTVLGYTRSNGPIPNDPTNARGTITLTAAFDAASGATLSYNGVNATNGVSTAVPIVAGDNQIRIDVTAGRAVTSYTLSYTRLPSTDNWLSALSTAPNVLTGANAFDAFYYDYAATVLFETSTISVTASFNASSGTTAQVFCTDAPTPQALSSGVASAALPLSVATNAVTVRVTAQSGATRDYVLLVTRLGQLAAPTLVSQSPAHQQNNVLTSVTSLSLTFSQTDVVGVRFGEVRVRDLTGQQPDQVFATDSGSVVKAAPVSAVFTVNGLSLAASRTYQVTVSAAAFQNSRGFNFTGVAAPAWRFTTEGVAIAPSVLGFLPADNSVVSGPAVTALAITFSELVTVNLAVGSNVQVIDVTGLDALREVTPANVRVVGRVATLPLPSALNSGRSYRVTVPANMFVDFANVAFPGFNDATTWNFETGFFTDSAMGSALTNAGFETPSVAADSGAFRANPTGATWTFTGPAGIARVGAMLSSSENAASPIPEGAQVAYLNNCS